MDAADLADAPGDSIPEVADSSGDLLLDGTDATDGPSLLDVQPDTDGPTDHPAQLDTAPSVCSLGAGQGAWAKGWTGPKPPVLGAMAAAVDGTVWATGQIWANFDFGSGTVVYNAQNGDGTPATTPSGFVAKVNPATGSASAAWGFAKMSDKQQSPLLVAVAGVDSSGGGNVGIAGSFDGEMDFTPNDSNSATGKAGLDYISTGGLKAFYAVFDGASSGANLTPVKAHVVNVGNGGTLLAFASGPTQNAFVVCGKTSIVVSKWKDSGTNTGLILDPLAPDAGVGAFGGGNTDLVVAKINAATGAVIWGKQYGGAGDQVCESAALDAAGNVIIAGNYSGDLFQLDNVSDTSGTVAKLFLAKLNADDGTLISAVGFAGSGILGISHANALTVDGAGNIVMGGSIGNSVDFNSGHVASYTGLNDAFAAKFDSTTLSSLWVKSDGDAGYDQVVKSVAVSSNGDVFIGGNFKGSLPYLALGDSTHNGALDAFAAQLASADGKVVCAHAYGDAQGAQQINNIVVARTAAGPLLDSVLIGGKFTDTIKLGDTTLAWPGNSCTSIDAGDNSGCISGASCTAGICLEDSLNDYFIARLVP